ncbi:MAG: cobalamin B12-binding domain-containing protein [Candidatus Rokubacteria bacterium]|nr:cobalamin B12-binding domain-containing protein [Candidatus Rokubacteria bacterium]MBI3104358.1 cobalamin B12-binding domain-containing protein [Candidatus Rokubacteria bacterium]
MGTRVAARRIRVLLVKTGLDGHDRGVLVVAKALSRAGMEVIYGGLHLRPVQIAKMAAEESVDVVGLSSLSDNHRALVPRIIQELKTVGLDDVLVLLGGFIQDEDVPVMKAAGVAEVFGVGTRLEDIATYIQTHVRAG